MDLIDTIVRHVLRVRYEDLPSQAVEMVKKLAIDTIGTTIAGSSALGSKTVVDLVRVWGGKEESSVLIYGGMVPAHNAALVNCTMARALDLDDVHEAGGGHLAATFVPASLALAEYGQKPVNGRDLILAICVGADLSCRLRCALTTLQGWVGGTFAPFGVVAMAGRLLGFDEERMLNGMGIAYSQCCTNLQAYIDGGLSGRLQQGIGASAGILATVLAEKGYTGARDILQGTYGFYPLYARNEYDPRVITDQLGERFEIVNTSIKPYPTCKQTHIPISAILEIVKDNDVDPAKIERIIVHTNSKAYNMTAQGDNKYHPRNPVDAQFSIPFTVATAAVKRKVFIDDFTEESIKNGEILEVAQKVRVQVDSELEAMARNLVPNRIELVTTDGQHYSKYVEFVKGNPKNQMSLTECVAKFRDCVRFSARPLEPSKIAEIVELTGNLEEVDDVRKIVRPLVA